MTGKGDQPGLQTLARENQRDAADCYRRTVRDRTLVGDHDSRTVGFGQFNRDDLGDGLGDDLENDLDHDLANQVREGA